MNVTLIDILVGLLAVAVAPLVVQGVVRSRTHLGKTMQIAAGTAVAVWFLVVWGNTGRDPLQWAFCWFNRSASSCKDINWTREANRGKQRRTEIAPPRRASDQAPPRNSMSNNSLNSTLKDELSDPRELLWNSSELPVSWEVVLSRLLSMPPGARKEAIVKALLIAKQHPPFRLGGNSKNTGFDSPGLLSNVLASVGVVVTPKASERLSKALMRTTTETHQPMPGDLVFYKGSVGSFGLIAIYVDPDENQGIGVGTLESGYPGAVYDFAMNPAFRKVGYFSVIYPDEQ